MIPKNLPNFTARNLPSFFFVSMRWGLLVQEFKGSDGNDRFEKYTVVKVTMKPCFEVDCYSASGSTSPKKSQA